MAKTLSMATAMLALCLLAEKEKQRRKPVIIFAPATLCEQWQTELMDKLGIPCARWHTQKKLWWDPDNRAISPAGAGQIAKCPLRIGIVSTGLMMRDSDEKQYLLGLNYGLVILDEAHKARTRQGIGGNAGTPNELLSFIREIAARSDHVLLGTATPIQTKTDDLWDLVRVLHQGQGRFVLGNDFSRWHRPQEVLPVLSGEEEVLDPQYGWELLRSPLPVVESTRESGARRLYNAIRQDLNLTVNQWQAGPYTDLSPEVREDLEIALEKTIAGATFFQRENPLVRHVVLRKRTTLEDEGLLKRIGVDIHPDPGLASDVNSFHALFEGMALRTSEHFREAYGGARAFAKALGKRGRGGGFMKNLMEQRICSSVVAGISTARTLLEGRTVHEELDDQDVDIAIQTEEERAALTLLLHRLEQVKDDPKLNAVIHYLEVEKWLNHGVIMESKPAETSPPASRRTQHEPLSSLSSHQANPPTIPMRQCANNFGYRSTLSKSFTVFFFRPRRCLYFFIAHATQCHIEVSTDCIHG